MAQTIASAPRELLRKSFRRVRSVRRLVTDPETFFDRKVHAAHIKWEVVAVLLVGAAALPGVYYVSSLVGEATDVAQYEFAQTGVLLRPLIVTFALWIGYSLSFHVIANRMRGRGPPGQLFKGTAWALVPIGIGNLVQSVAMIVVFSRMDVQAALSGRDAREQLLSVVNSSMREPGIVVAMAFFLLMLLWSGYLMTYVVQFAKDVERRTAAKVIAVPFIVHVVYLVVGLARGSTNAAMVL